MDRRPRTGRRTRARRSCHRRRPGHRRPRHRHRTRPSRPGPREAVPRDRHPDRAARRVLRGSRPRFASGTGRAALTITLASASTAAPARPVVVPRSRCRSSLARVQRPPERRWPGRGGPSGRPMCSTSSRGASAAPTSRTHSGPAHSADKSTTVGAGTRGEPTGASCASTATDGPSNSSGAIATTAGTPGRPRARPLGRRDRRRLLRDRVPHRFVELSTDPRRHRVDVILTRQVERHPPVGRRQQTACAAGRDRALRREPEQLLALVDQRGAVDTELVAEPRCGGVERGLCLCSHRGEVRRRPRLVYVDRLAGDHRCEVGHEEQRSAHALLVGGDDPSAMFDAISA